MTLTDIISKITQYAKKLIVTDNSSTTAASIAQAGTGDALSITGTTGTGASVTTTTGTGAVVSTTTGTTLKLQQNNPNPAIGGTLDFFPTTGGEMVFNGGTDGKFAFTNSSVSPTKATVFLGANVGIEEAFPQCSLQVNGAVRARAGAPGANGINNNGYAFNNPADNDSGMFSTGDGSVEFYSNNAEVMRVSNTGNVGINTSIPQRKLHVLGTVRLQSLPTFATNAAAIAGGLVADDVYKTAAGELSIVV
jgi:hypothetical protein